MTQAQRHLRVVTLVPNSEKRSTLAPAPPTAVNPPRGWTSSAKTLFGVHGCLDICSPARFHRYTAGSAPAAITCWPVSLSACGGAAVGTLEAHAPAANDHMVMHPPPHPIAAQFSALSRATHPTHAPLPCAPLLPSLARHTSMTWEHVSDLRSWILAVPSSDPVTAWFAPTRAATQCSRSLCPRRCSAGV